MATIKIINTSENFEKLRSDWNALLEASEANCFFLSWEWLFTWWRHLADGRKLFIVTLQGDAGLEAIAPFSIRPPRWGRLLPFQALEFLGPGMVGSAYLDLIIRRGRENEAIDALAEYLSRERLVLDLTQLKSGLCQARRLAGRLENQGWGYVEEKTEICPFIDLSGQSWSSYLATLGSQHRYNFQKKLRKATREYDLKFEKTDSEEQRQKNLSLLIALHQMRWRDRSGESHAFHLPALRAFHQDLSCLALERGWLRLFILWLGDRPVAALYGFRYHSVFYFYQSGFDPDYAKQSVGLVAMGLAIKAAIEEGAEEYDLLHGAEAYKFHWARGAHDLGRLELYPPKGYGVLCRGTSALRRVSKRIAVRVLQEEDV